jgi:hypothetical protein
MAWQIYLQTHTAYSLTQWDHRNLNLSPSMHHQPMYYKENAKSYFFVLKQICICKIFICNVGFKIRWSKRILVFLLSIFLLINDWCICKLSNYFGQEAKWKFYKLDRITCRRTQMQTSFTIITQQSKVREYIMLEEWFGKNEPRAFSCKKDFCYHFLGFKCVLKARYQNNKSCHKNIASPWTWPWFPHS